MNVLVRFWHLKDLRNKVLLTLFLLLIVRILIFIPVPLIHAKTLSTLFSQNSFLGFLNIFSGGGLSNFSIITMGVGPYITAAIIMQLLTVIVPTLEELQKEGEAGQRQINQYARLMTLPLAIIQAYAVLLLLKRNGVISSWTPINLSITLIMMSAATIFVMWIGEIISENGVGNGISLIITLGILGSLPVQFEQAIANVQTSGSYTSLLALLVITLISIIIVIIIDQAKRLIPVAYARRLRSGEGTGSVPSNLPIKLNTAGVVPIIFGIAVLIAPTFLGQFLTGAKTPWVAHLGSWLDTAFQSTTVIYNVLYFFLVFAFTYFYTYIIFKPEQVAEDLQKQGGFIPGVRPGRETQAFIRTTINRITLFGGLFLAFIAVFPAFFTAEFPGESLLLRGTSLLIVISVLLETMRQIQSHYLMRTYDVYN